MSQPIYLLWDFKASDKEIAAALNEAMEQAKIKASFAATPADGDNIELVLTKEPQP